MKHFIHYKKNISSFDIVHLSGPRSNYDITESAGTLSYTGKDTKNKYDITEVEKFYWSRGETLKSTWAIEYNTLVRIASNITTGFFLVDANNPNPYMGYTSKEKDFGINYRFTNLTTLASAGNPGGYPTGPFKIYSWDAINNIWHLEYNNTNTYPILHIHEFDFISSKIKIECTNSFVFVPANGDFNIYNV